MTVIASGAEGARVELVNDTVVIQREGLFASLRQGKYVEVPLWEISQVLVTSPSMGLSGAFVLVPFGQAANGGFASNNTNPWSVYFTGSQQPEFERLRSAILKRLRERDTLTPQEPEPGQAGEPVDWQAIEPVLLILTARPRHPLDIADLNVDLEEREILEELQRTSAHEHVEVRFRPATTADTLLNDLLEARPTVVHFSGHGLVEGLIIETHGRGSALASEASLVRMFQIPEIAARLRILVLNACLSAQQANALSSTVPAVVGTLDSVLDTTAIAFSQGFYNALGHGTSTASAFAAGTARASLECGEEEAQKYALFHRSDVDTSSWGLLNR